MITYAHMQAFVVAGTGTLNFFFYDWFCIFKLEENNFSDLGVSMITKSAYFPRDKDP